METLKLKKHLTPQQAEKLAATFLGEKDYDTLVQHDCDAYNSHGKLLFKFRKNVIPFDILKTGVDAFKDSISLTDGRGMASGGKQIKRVLKDGTVSKRNTFENKVFSGNVGFMDNPPRSTIPYCRKTAFARQYFEKYTAGIPFVQEVDRLYKELCPTYYDKQIAIARFTTVTVNRNFQTAVHKDTGDYPEGFGNLCVYREGDFTGSYFCLPEYRVAIDMQNCDMLFVDVHTWHGNTPFVGTDYTRIAFVMYYREYMYKCKQPAEELKRVQQDKNGFLRL